MVLLAVVRPRWRTRIETQDASGAWLVRASGLFTIRQLVLISWFDVVCLLEVLESMVEFSGPWGEASR